MRRLVAVILGAYLLLAVGNKVAEHMGAMQCGCTDDCWCRKPGLSLFRWVFPYWHRSHTAEQKAALAQDH